MRPGRISSLTKTGGGQVQTAARIRAFKQQKSYAVFLKIMIATPSAAETEGVIFTLK